MPVLRKLVSSLRLGKERRSDPRLGDAPIENKKSAKLLKRNKSALDLDRILQPRDQAVIDGMEHPDAARPNLAKHHTRSFVSSRPSFFERERLDEEFDAELREFSALAQRNETREALQTQKCQLKLWQDAATASGLGFTLDSGNLQRSAEKNPAAIREQSPAYGDQMHTAALTDSVLVRGSAVHETAVAGWSSSADDSMSGSSGVAGPAGNTQTGSHAIAASSSNEVCSGTHHIPRRAVRNPYRNGKQPAIRDPDELLTASVAKYSDASLVTPPDSAVASPEVNSSAYRGEGRARVDDDVTHSLAIWEDAFRKIHAESARMRRDQNRLVNEAQARAQAERLLWEEKDRIQALELQAQFERELEEEERLAAERGRSRDCAVCGDAKDPLEFPARAPTSLCEHGPRTCNECLQSWMASEFDTKGCDGIKCVECPQMLDYIDVQRAASAETFEAYDKMSTRNALGSLEEFGWCLAPGCTSGQLNVENSNYMDCVNCGYTQCLKHKVEWHTNETCEQYDYRTSGQKARDEDRATEEMLDSVSKKCPGPSCNWRIQKTDGCDHMTCKKCRFEFCWQCLAAQTEIKRVGNTAHEPSCKFHSANLEVAWPFNVH